jgi:DNA excision repair protein ERCC-6-like 2
MSDSETEDEFDVTIKSEDLQSRPGFPLSASQTLLGPLILDAEKNVKVPGAINTYLRDYQREGVKFFWSQYQEKRGGLLGDDMGLVSAFSNTITLFLTAL